MKTNAWANRIVGYGKEAPDQLLANPKNWRIHPRHQQNVLGGVLQEVGIVQNIIVNKRAGPEWSDDERGVETVLDGHLRVSMAISNGEKSIPVTYVDLSPDEESLILATLDPISALAVSDSNQLDSLISEISTKNKDILDMLGELSVTNEQDDIESEEETEEGRKTLQERFVVPPFTILDARQGYWQKRKHAWFSLGIKSEIGRFGK